MAAADRAADRRLRLSGSAPGTSAAFLSELAPGVVLAPLAGRLADRPDRRRVMLAVTLAQGVSLALPAAQRAEREAHPAVQTGLITLLQFAAPTGREAGCSAPWA